MSHSISESGSGNEISIGPNVTATGFVVGNNNRIVVLGAHDASILRIGIHGDGNEIIIGRAVAIKDLQISCGNHVKAHRTRLEIDDGFSIEPQGRIFLYNSGNRLSIGKNCMFSSHVTIRCGESPHLIFDRLTGEYLEPPGSVVIGEHVWIGENVYLTKSAGIADECVVGANSLVSRKFSQRHAVIAGNPAGVVKEGIQWIRNSTFLEEGSLYKQSFDAHNARFVGPAT